MSTQRKVITDKDGRMRTVDVAPPPSAEEMGRFRKSVHDHIAGNAEPWHVDPNAAPKKPDPEVTESIYLDPDWCGMLRTAQEHSHLEGQCNCLHDGGICDSCAPPGGALYQHYVAGDLDA